MKVLIMRHGESMDDIDNQYGGWSDFDLSPKGKEQISTKIEKIKALGINFEMIFSSPLKRAIQSSEILSSGLGLSVETFEYEVESFQYINTDNMSRTNNEIITINIFLEIRTRFKDINYLIFNVI